MNHFVLLFSSILLFANMQLCWSQSYTRIDDCAKQILSYKDRRPNQSPIFPVRLTSVNGGRLLYIGADRHSYDPTDFQFEEFEKAWNTFKPTQAFFEGIGSDIRNSRDQAIKNSGEPGLVRFLAARDKIPATSLEPGLQDEINYLLTRFSAEQVKLFYVLRETAQVRERRRYSEPELKRIIVSILDRWTKMKGLEDVVKDTTELKSAYSRIWKSPENWWEAYIDWFNPLKSSSQTGGIFTNEVNQASSHFRNLYMFRLLADATLKGERIFAIVGREHLPMQEPALKCAIK